MTRKLLSSAGPPVEDCKELAPQTVNVQFDIDEQGLPVNIRTDDRSNADVRLCAVKLVGNLRYSPGLPETGHRLALKINERTGKTPNSLPIAPPQTITTVQPSFRYCEFRGQKLVKVSFTVDVKGRPTAVAVASSSGLRCFDAGVIDAVKQYRYLAATQGGVPVEFPLFIEIQAEQ